MNMQRQKKIVDETMEICRGFIRKIEQQSMDVFKHADSHGELDVMFESVQLQRLIPHCS